MRVTSASGQSDSAECEREPNYAEMPGFLLTARLPSMVGGELEANCRAIPRADWLCRIYHQSLFALSAVSANEQSGDRRPGCAGLVLLDVNDPTQGGNQQAHARLLLAG